MHPLLALERGHNESTAKYCIDIELQLANVKEIKPERVFPSFDTTLISNQFIPAMSVLTKADVSPLYF